MMRYLATAMLPIVLAASAAAHHAANAYFGGEIVLIEGTIRGAKIVNPHSYLRITMDDGTDWVFESQQSGTVLRQLGFTADMFANGRRVLMSGDSNQDGKKVARWRTFAFPGQSEEDDVEVYIVGRFDESELIKEIRNNGGRCGNSIELCYLLNTNARAKIKEKYGDEATLW